MLLNEYIENIIYELMVESTTSFSLSKLREMPPHTKSILEYISSSGLQRVGSGTTRTVFGYGNRYVIKVATNYIGLENNKQEIEFMQEGFSILPKLYDFEKEKYIWYIAEKVNSLTGQSKNDYALFEKFAKINYIFFEKLTRYNFALYLDIIHNRISKEDLFNEIQEVLEKDKSIFYNLDEKDKIKKEKKLKYIEGYIAEKVKLIKNPNSFISEVYNFYNKAKSRGINLSVEEMTLIFQYGISISSEPRLVLVDFGRINPTNKDIDLYQKKGSQFGSIENSSENLKIKQDFENKIKSGEIVISKDSYVDWHSGSFDFEGSWERGDFPEYGIFKNGTYNLAAGHFTGSWEKGSFLLPKDSIFSTIKNRGMLDSFGVNPSDFKEIKSRNLNLEEFLSSEEFVQDIVDSIITDFIDYDSTRPDYNYPRNVTIVPKFSIENIKFAFINNVAQTINNAIIFNLSFTITKCIDNKTNKEEDLKDVIKSNIVENFFDNYFQVNNLENLVNIFQQIYNTEDDDQKDIKIKKYLYETNIFYEIKQYFGNLTLENITKLLNVSEIKV